MLNRSEQNCWCLAQCSLLHVNGYKVSFNFFNNISSCNFVMDNPANTLQTLAKKPVNLAQVADALENVPIKVILCLIDWLIAIITV